MKFGVVFFSGSNGGQDSIYTLKQIIGREDVKGNIAGMCNMGTLKIIYI